MNANVPRLKDVAHLKNLYNVPQKDILLASYLIIDHCRTGVVVGGEWFYAPVAMVEEEGHDCCNAATACVLTNITGSKVANVSRLTAFDNEYKFVNRILPVYRVAFNRPDGIRLYVETTQDRFTFAIDNKRAVFDTIFQWLHTWSWLNALGERSFHLIKGRRKICSLAGQPVQQYRSKQYTVNHRRYKIQ